MKVFLAISFLFYLGLTCYAQQSKVINFGRTDQSLVCWDGIIDNNGNHIFGFVAEDHSGIAFVDANYNTVWAKNIGSAGSRQIIKTENGIYVNIGGEEMFAFDSLGTVLWNKRMQNNSLFFEILELDSNNIIVSFRESAQPGIMSIDCDGNINWTRQLSNPFGFELGISDIFALNDGNFALVTYIRENANVTKQLLIKIDPSGSIIWQKFHQSMNHAIGFARGYQASNNDIYLVGHNFSLDSTSTLLKDMLVVKMDNIGTFLDGKQYGHTFDDESLDIKEDKNQNFIILGNTKPTLICGGNLSILSLNSNLDTLFTKHYGTLNANGAYYSHLRKRGDAFYSYGYGTLWTTINNYSDCHVIKSDENFELGCLEYKQQLNVSAFNDFQSSSSAFNYHNHAIIFSDSLVDSPSFLESADACTGETLSHENTSSNDFNIYPNPSHGSVTIDFKFVKLNSEILITNITGQLVGTFLVDQSNSALINISAFPEGIYFVNIKGSAITKKLIID